MSHSDDDALPGDPEEVKETRRVVHITADLLEIAAQVIDEMNRRDGKEFSTQEDSEPSIPEMCGIASLIITGKMSGIYVSKKDVADKKGPSLNDPASLLKSIESLVKTEVTIALSKASRSPSFPRLPAAQPAPVMPPVPRAETNLPITCGCGGIMRTYWRPDGTMGIQCENCQEGGRGRPSTVAKPAQ